MEHKTIGEFIAKLRKELGITQKQLAEKLNVSDKTISHWERGDSSPDLSIIPEIADIFGVTCDELLRGERSNNLLVNSKDSDEKQEMNNISQLDKNLNKFQIKVITCFITSFLGVVFGVFAGLLLKNVFVGLIVFLFFAVLSIFGIILSSVIYVFSMRSDFEISKAVAKEYRIKGTYVFGKWIFYFFGFYCLILDVMIVISDLEYRMFPVFILWIIYVIVSEIIFIIIRSLDLHKKKEFNKKRIQSGVIISVVILLLTSGTAFFQYSYYNGNMDVDVTAMKFTDVNEFKKFMEIDNRIVFNHHGNNSFLYDEQDNCIEFEWKNELVTDYEIYEEEDNVIFAYLLPEGSTVYWNILWDFLFEVVYFVYPVIMSGSILVFYIRLTKIEKESKKTEEKGGN